MEDKLAYQREDTEDTHRSILHTKMYYPAS